MSPRNFYVLWIERAFYGALSAVGFRDKSEIMRGLVLWAVAVLALYKIPWDQWLHVTDTGTGDEVRLGLCGVLAILVVWVVCFVYQLIVQPGRIYSDALKRIDDAERVIVAIADAEGDRRFLSEAYAEGFRLYRAPIIDDDPEKNIGRWKADMDAWVEKVRTHIRQKWSITALHEFNDLGSTGGFTYRRAPDDTGFDNKYPDEHGFSVFCTYSAYLKNVGELVRFGDHLGDGREVLARYRGETINNL